VNFQRKPQAKASKKVWRMTPGAPEGEWVDPIASSPPPRPEAPERTSGTWAMSSFDLMYGADVKEISDTVPDDLLAELFRPQEAAPKTPRR